jgi:hypothetical protein
VALEATNTLGEKLGTPTNSAKCSTSKDDQTKVKGTLSCGSSGNSWSSLPPHRALL